MSVFWLASCEMNSKRLLRPTVGTAKADPESGLKTQESNAIKSVSGSPVIYRVIGNQNNVIMSSAFVEAKPLCGQLKDRALNIG